MHMTPEQIALAKLSKTTAVQPGDPAPAAMAVDTPTIAQPTNPTATVQAGNSAPAPMAVDTPPAVGDAMNDQGDTVPRGNYSELFKPHPSSLVPPPAGPDGDFAMVSIGYGVGVLDNINLVSPNLDGLPNRFAMQRFLKFQEAVDCYAALFYGGHVHIIPRPPPPPPGHLRNPIYIPSNAPTPRKRIAPRDRHRIKHQVLSGLDLGPASKSFKAPDPITAVATAAAPAATQPAHITVTAPAISVEDAAKLINRRTLKRLRTTAASAPAVVPAAKRTSVSFAIAPLRTPKQGPAQPMPTPTPAPRSIPVVLVSDSDSDDGNSTTDEEDIRKVVVIGSSDEDDLPQQPYSSAAPFDPLRFRPRPFPCPSPLSGGVAGASGPDSVNATPTAGAVASLKGKEKAEDPLATPDLARISDLANTLDLTQTPDLARITHLVQLYLRKCDAELRKWEVELGLSDGTSMNSTTAQPPSSTPAPSSPLYWPSSPPVATSTPSTSNLNIASTSSASNAASTSEHLNANRDIDLESDYGVPEYDAADLDGVEFLGDPSAH